jgi:hypothetical protein
MGWEARIVYRGDGALDDAGRRGLLGGLELSSWIVLHWFSPRRGSHIPAQGNALGTEKQE